MISFKQFLSEVFDNPFKWNKSTDKHGTSYSFGDGYNLKIDTHRFADNTKTSVARFDFNGTYYPRYSGKHDKVEPFRVYATVKDVAKDFVKNDMQKGSHLIFTAVDDKTVPIYNAIGKRIAAETGADFQRMGHSNFKLKK